RSQPGLQPVVKAHAIVTADNVVQARQHLQVALVLVEQVRNCKVYRRGRAEGLTQVVGQAQVRQVVRRNAVNRYVDTFDPLVATYCIADPTRRPRGRYRTGRVVRREGQTEVLAVAYADVFQRRCIERRGRGRNQLAGEQTQRQVV